MSTVTNLQDAKADWNETASFVHGSEGLLPKAIVYAAAMLASAIEKAAGR